MLITDNSILKNLPISVGKKQILILDSLRFVLEMIDYSYENLLVKLTQVSENAATRNLPEIFGYAWSIIDNSNRVVSIAKQLPWEYPDKILGHLYYVKEFRNTFQHLDERIDESLLKTQSPFLGVISWADHKFEEKQIELIQIISGNLLHGPSAKQTFPNINDCQPGINNIFLHTVNKKGQTIETDLGILMKNLKKLVIEFEMRFKDLTPVNWSSRQDIVLRIKQPNQPE